MRIYTVHIDPLSVADDRGAVIIAEGFSWSAAAFNVFWAVYHGLWDWAAILLMAALALSATVAFRGLDAISAMVVQAGFAALVGVTSNDWRRWFLSRRGYRLAGIVSADSEGAAERRYFSRAVEAGHGL